MHGGDALRIRLDAYARTGAKTTWHAQLSALTATQRGRAIALQVTNRDALLRMLSQQTSPNPVLARRLARAYQLDHVTSRTGAIRRRLTADRGQPIHIATTNDQGIPSRSVRPTSAEWDGIIAHWRSDDQQALDQAWEDLVAGMDLSGNQDTLLTGYVDYLSF